MPDGPDSGTIPQDDSIERDLKRRVRRAERTGGDLSDEVAAACAERGISLDSENWPENQVEEPVAEDQEPDPDPGPAEPTELDEIEPEED